MKNIFSLIAADSMSRIVAASRQSAILFAFILAFSLQPSASGAYTLTFAPPLPSDTNGSLSGYQGFWQFTNTVSTNTWYLFGSVPTGATRISIPVFVGSPSWITLRSYGTNGALSTNLTLVLYNTNALAATLTNNVPVVPPAPTALAITNN